MLDRIIATDKIEKLKKLIDGSKRIAITCHLAPDGDALGSTLAMWHLLRQLGKTAHVVTPDVPASHLMFIPGAKELVPFSRFDEFGKQIFRLADLVICLDFNALHRIDRLRPVVEECKASKVLIDHHINPENFADVTISHPEISSTCMLLFRVICQLGWEPLIDRQTASCIYTGMMTDTGNFSYNSCDPDLYIVISHLLKKGIDKDQLYKLAFNTKKENVLRLNGFALSERMTVFPEHSAALIVLSLADLERFSYRQGDTEGLVNMPLSIPEVQYVAYLREGKDYIKVSTRSEGEIPVNHICETYFNGGGHKNAAGGEFYGTLEEAAETFVKAMPEYDKYLKNNDKK